MKLGDRGAKAQRVRMGFEIDQLLNLPDEEKQQMALDLLEQFGAQNIKIVGDEITHSCVLPFGLHTNGDRNPSAQLNWRKLTYNCYGCGSGGGLLWFVGTCKGEDTGGIVSWITKKIGTESESKGLQNFLAYIDKVYSPVNAKIVQPIPKFNRNVLEPWRFIHPYLTVDCHIPESNIIAHDVGYDPKADRIVLPHYWNGELVGWQTRWPEKKREDGTPKYKNTPDFPKDQTLYNRPTDRNKPLLVVESVMSVVSKSHIWPAMVSTFGASVTERQKLLLADHSKVILWFDNDQAGWTATDDVAGDLSKYCDVFVVDSDLDADAADLTDDQFADQVVDLIPYGLWTPPTDLREVNDTP
jgi:Toprim-like